MTTSATVQKRQDLLAFIERELAPEPAVQAVIGIGSVASGLARSDSDIDAIVFLDPFYWYIVPAEFIWRPSDRSYHSIFSKEAGIEEGIQFDLARFSLSEWSDTSYEWPEERRADLQEGWVAYDRNGQVAELIATRTEYPDARRQARLDEAINWLDHHLADGTPEREYGTDPVSEAFIRSHDEPGRAWNMEEWSRRHALPPHG